MNLKPLSNKIVIEPLEQEKVTASGIMLPENASDKSTHGKVIAVGPGKRNEKGEIIPMSVTIGNIIVYKKYGPDEVEINGQKYVIGDEDDILAIIE